MFHVPKVLGLALAVFAAAQTTPEIEKDKKLLQGSWETVSMVFDGKDVPGQKEGKLVFTFEGDKLTVKLGDKIMNEGIYTLDPSKSPKTIDIKDTRDTILGIYEVKENEAKLCMGLRGRDRPKEFTARAGSDQSMVTLKRLK